MGGTKGELLTLADALVIHPPYGEDNCFSTNEIILGKIQGLIKNMPAGQEQWWLENCYSSTDPQIRLCNWKLFSYYPTKTYVVGTQKNAPKTYV